MPTQTVRDPNRWAVLALVGVAQLMVVLDATIVTVALPSAQRALHFSNDSRQWVVTAYALAFGSLLLVGGKVGDLFGRKWALIAGLVGFSAASAVGGLAQSFDVLVAARATQGAVRRVAGTRGAVAVDGHVRGDCGLGPGVRDLRRGRRRRRGAGAAARGGADAGAVVALVPVRQSGDRGAYHDRGGAPAGQPQALRPRPDRHSRRAHLVIGAVRARVRLLQRRDPRVGRHGDRRRAHRQPAAADRVRADRAPRRAPVAALAYRVGSRARRGRTPRSW